MKTTLYYFSGTGNSLAMARKLARLIGEADVVPIIRMIMSGETDVDADCVGLVFPVYCQDVPEVVRDFISRINVKKDATIFAVTTSNAVPGNVLYNLDRLLRKKGLRLGAGFNIDMPGNYIAFVDYSNPEDVRVTRLEESERSVQEIARILHKHNSIHYSYKLQSHLKSSLNKFVLGNLYRGERKFYADSSCTRCGTCVKVCPRNNINMSDEGVAWGTTCYQCLACLHWCPVASIQNGGKTKNRIRYHHPEISVKDIIAQKLAVS